MQILGSCRPSASQDLLTRMSACIDEVAEWMRSNWLQLSTAKAQFLWSTTSHRLYQLPQSLFRVGSDHISPASPVRDFVIYVDSDDLMRSRVAKTVSACYSVLHQLQTVRLSVSRSVLQSLVSSLVLLRLDYGNSILAGVSSHLLSRLQSVMNAVARLIFSSSRFQHIAPLLRQLHWLKAPERIAFQQSVLVYKCLHGSAPAYLTDELCQVADVKTRQRLRSTSSSLIVSRTRLPTVGD